MISEERLAEIRGLHGERRHVASDCMMCDLLDDRDTLAARLAKLNDREWIGRLMHESWTKTKRAQGFHHRSEMPDEAWGVLRPGKTTSEPEHEYRPHQCALCHPDLIPWDELPEKQKDINRHAFDAVRAALPSPSGGGAPETYWMGERKICAKCGYTVTRDHGCRCAAP